MTTLRALVPLALLALGCQQREQPVRRSTLPITLRASEPNGEPVADVRVWADGRELGTTGAQGQLNAALEGVDGQRFALSFACPASHRTPNPRRELRLRAPRPIAGHDAPLALAVACEPVERVAALVVRARGPRSAGLPVHVQGELLGQTARDGTAHLLIRARAHSVLRVMLDTSAVPALRPTNPVHSFELGQEDRLVLFEQRFTVEARAPISRQATPRRPYRID